MHFIIINNYITFYITAMVSSQHCLRANIGRGMIQVWYKNCYAMIYLSQSGSYTLSENFHHTFRFSFNVKFFSFLLHKSLCLLDYLQKPWLKCHSSFLQYQHTNNQTCVMVLYTSLSSLVFLLYCSKRLIIIWLFNLLTLMKVIPEKSQAY